MAQLSDDCFAFGTRLVPIDEALAQVREQLQPITGTETVSLTDAVGRILAEDVVSDRSVPPHDNAAVDGYAVFFDDLAPAGPTVLPVTGRVAAGHPLDREPRRGEALRVFTGATLPAGPDTLFMEEDCRASDGAPPMVELPPGIRRGANRREAGEDVRAGDRVLPAGRRLRPQDVGMAASVGRSALSVRRRLRVALFSTGDEIREPGEPAPPGCIYDANRFTLAALLDRLGCVVTDFGIVADTLAACSSALERAEADHDAVIASGGMSSGEEDHVKAAVAATGGAVGVWRLAIKPGRPVAVGAIGRRKIPFIGLPGNPVAVMVTFTQVARPVLLRLAGAEPEPVRTFPVVTDFAYRKKRDRREFVRVSLGDGDGPTPVARLFPREGAGILSSMVESDGLVVLDEATTDLAPGTVVAYLPFSEIL